MVPMYYLILEFLRYYDFILTPFKVKINITTSTKRTLMVRTIIILSCYARFRPLVFLGQFEVNSKIIFSYFFDVIEFCQYLMLKSGLLCRLLIPIEWYP